MAARLGVAGVAAFVLGPLLAHFQVVPAMVGFILFDLGGLLGLVTLIVAVISAVRGGLSRAGGALLLGGGLTLAFVLIAMPSAKVPPINDITTDATNPPQFVKAPALDGNQGRDLRYPGAAFADQQRAGYPDLAPLRLSAPPDEVFKRVDATARQMPNWEITRSDPAAHALEGVASTALFHFQDDFVVEVRPQDGGSVVQMRSKSRNGKGDVGANAARIRMFFAKLQG